MINFAPFIDLITDTIISHDLQILEVYKNEEKYQWVCSNHLYSFLIISLDKTTPCSLTITPFFNFAYQPIYLRPQKTIGTEIELLGWMKDNLISALNLSDAFIKVVEGFATLVQDAGIASEQEKPMVADRGQGVEFIWKIEDVINSNPIIMFFKLRLTNRAMVLKTRFEGDEWATLKTSTSYDVIALGIENKIRSIISRLTPDVKFYLNILKEPGYYGENVVAFPPAYTKISLN